MRRRLSPAVTLFFLAALIAESLSGATAPVVFFLFPPAYLTLTIFYGSGALLIRETALRWGKGWPSVLALGAAFAIVEEGLGTKLLFDPRRTDVNPLVNYGNWGGIHWPLALHLIIYHAVYSITIPILLTTLTFPAQRAQPWIGRRAFRVHALLFVLFTGVLFSSDPTFFPPPGPYVLAALAALGFFGIARRLPRTLHPAEQQRVPRERWFWGVGVAATVAFFAVSWVSPGLRIHPLLIMGLSIGLLVGVGRLVLVGTGNGAAWPPTHRLALAAGALAPFILISPLHDLRGNFGMTLVGLAAALFLYRLRRRLRRDRQSGQLDGGTPPIATTSQPSVNSEMTNSPYTACILSDCEAGATGAAPCQSLEAGVAGLQPPSDTTRGSRHAGDKEQQPDRNQS